MALAERRLGPEAFKELAGAFWGFHETRPYMRARNQMAEALRHAGLWDAIKDRLVLGENVSQAAQFATQGDTQGGIIAYSLALAPEARLPRRCSTGSSTPMATCCLRHPVILA